MRAGGGCTVQQALTPEAAAVVKQAVGLARRRGHAQVTPLHVASTMLSSASGLLRSACLQSHSHPLQCKALELCFNVALNRLPASSSASSPILGGPHPHPHPHPPSLSNALVAAFKRAQAHQRRGSVESQQQPLLAVKIELEQLIISILDDPSVSRVMREASFSSTQVKANVEQAVSSLETAVAPAAAPNPNHPSPSKPNELFVSKPPPPPPPPPTSVNQACSARGTHHEAVAGVVEGMLRASRRSVAVVGECLASTEGVVRGVMDRVERGEVPEVLRNLQFITLPLFSFRSLGRGEVEQKFGELRCLVKSCCVGGGGGGGRVGRGAVLYLGDLSWAAEYYRAAEKGRGYYCPVEHVMVEIRGLVGCAGGGGGLWVMGVATYQTYTSCRTGNPSLEALLGLQPLTIPAVGLHLSLNCTDSYGSDSSKSKRSGDGLARRWPLLEDGMRHDQLTCCSDCSIKFESEARGLPKASSSTSSHGGSMITSTLPSWLQQYKESENKQRATSNDQESLQHLCNKWNSICDSTHKQRHYSSEITLHFSSAASPSSSPVSSSYDRQSWATARQWKEQSLWIPETVEEDSGHSSRLFYLEEHKSQGSDENPNPNPNSTCSSDTMEMEYLPRFKEISAENLKILCNGLEREVPWQKAIIPEIASTILQCRSGMLRRKEKSKLARAKDETWLFFQGGDAEGKEKMARELARLVFGSHTSPVSIELSSFSSTRSDSTDDHLRNKRSRSEASHGYLKRLFEAVRENPHRVFLVEDVEQVDSYSQMGIKAAMESGRMLGSNGEEVGVGDAIIILSCESFDSRSRACSPPVRQRMEDEEGKVDEDGDDKEIGSSVCLDLNLCAVDEDDDCSFDGVGLLESVDRAFFFKLPDDL